MTKTLTAIVLCLWASAASAQHSSPVARTPWNPQRAGTGVPPIYVGPGDVLSVPCAGPWYGLRAYNRAGALAHQPLVDIAQVNGGGGVCTIRALSSGGPGLTSSCTHPGDNGLTAGAFCTADGGTECATDRAYDLAGFGADTSASFPKQPGYDVNVLGGGTLPAWRFAAAAQLTLKSSTGFTFANPGTVIYVANSSAAGGGASNQNVVSIGTGFNTGFNSASALGDFYMFAGSQSNDGAYSTNTTYKNAATFNLISSLLYVDDSPTSMNPGGNAPANQLTIGGNPSTFFFDGYIAEVGICQILSPADVAAIYANETQYGY